MTPNMTLCGLSTDPLPPSFFLVHIVIECPRKSFKKRKSKNQTLLTAEYFDQYKEEGNFKELFIQKDQKRIGVCMYAKKVLTLSTWILTVST